VGDIFDSLDLFGDLPRAEPAGLPAEAPEAKPRTTIQRLRHSHHLLARSLAEGREPPEAAALSGFAISTVSNLQRDPAFKELVEYYRAQTRDIFESVQDRLGALGLSFLEELQDRLESDPDSFKHGQLLAIAEKLLDRSIAPSKGFASSKSSGGSGVNIQIAFVDPPRQAPTLEARAEGARVVEVLELETFDAQENVDEGVGELSAGQKAR
jgi:hypothetical protein